jgi:hypothetical protein
MQLLAFANSLTCIENKALVYIYIYAQGNVVYSTISKMSTVKLQRWTVNRISSKLKQNLQDLVCKSSLSHVKDRCRSVSNVWLSRYFQERIPIGSPAWCEPSGWEPRRSYGQRTAVGCAVTRVRAPLRSRGHRRFVVSWWKGRKSSPRHAWMSMTMNIITIIHTNGIKVTKVSTQDTLQIAVHSGITSRPIIYEWIYEFSMSTAQRQKRELFRHGFSFRYKRLHWPETKSMSEKTAWVVVVIACVGQFLSHARDVASWRYCGEVICIWANQKGMRRFCYYYLGQSMRIIWLSGGWKKEHGLSEWKDRAPVTSEGSIPGELGPLLMW